MADTNPLHAGILLFQTFKLLDNQVRRAAEETTRFYGCLESRKTSGRRFLGVAHVLDLLVGKGTYEPQRPEHLEVLFVVIGGLFDSLFLAVRYIEVESNAKTFAQLSVATGADECVSIALNHLKNGSTIGDSTADNPADSVLHHEIEAALRRALNRLPALDGTI